MPKRKASKQSHLIKYLMAVPAIISLFSRFFSVLEYDARESGRSMVWLFALSLCLFACITVAWTGMLALLLVYLMSLNWTLLSALGLVCGLNLFFLCILIIMLSRAKRHLFFPVTRQLLRDVISCD
jgi:hypothetical protein